MHPDLLQSPHLLPALVDLFVGEGEAAPTDAQVAHLVTCLYCNAALAIFSQAMRDAEELGRTQQQAAYAEVVMRDGVSEANRRYPEVVRHVEACEACREAVAETIAFLRET